jgi:Ca2+-binding RTX toxin-like protein
LFLDYRSPGGTRTFPLLGIPSLMTTLGGNLNDTMSMNFTLAGVVRAAFYGQDGNDTLTGSAGADLLVGGLGADNIKGGGGSDEIWGDERSTAVNGIIRDGLATGGNDTLNGGDGDDFIFGGGGSDYITDAGGNDYISGGLGNDIITDTGGDNFLRGGEGADQLTGGTGRDILIAGIGNDRVIGRANTDFMFAGDGADVIQDESVGNDVTVADISPYDDDVMVFTQPGTSLSGFSNNDLALQMLMFTGVSVPPVPRPNAWSGATVPGATTSSPAPFATRVSNLSGLASSLTADGDVDQILGNVGDVDYILSEQTRDVRLNAAGDSLYFV